MNFSTQFAQRKEDTKSNNSFDYPAQLGQKNNRGLFNNNNSVSFSTQINNRRDERIYGKENTFSMTQQTMSSGNRNNMGMQKNSNVFPNSTQFEKQSSLSGGNSFKFSNNMRNDNNNGCSLGMVSPPSKRMSATQPMRGGRGMQNSMNTYSSTQATSRVANQNIQQNNNFNFGNNSNNRQTSRQGPGMDNNNNTSFRSTNVNSKSSDAVVPQKMEVDPPSEKSFVMKKKSKPAVAKMITTSIKDLESWVHFKDKSPILFEIFGNLCSTISYHSSSPQKKFTINDASSNIGCVFWEIDRKMPHLSRGAMLRCIGKLHEGYFHCLSVRAIKPKEMQVLRKMMDRSGKVLQKEIAEAN